MKRHLPLAVLIICIVACGKKTKDDISSIVQISADSLQVISRQWKEDSLGCARLRDPKKIRQLIDQSALTGKDSTTVIEYLGHPDGRNYLKDSTVVFYYYMACGVKQGSSYNFYCNFEHGKLVSTQTAILN